MEKIKFAIVGCGRIAQKHAECIDKLGLLVAVCDVKEQRAKEMAEKYNAIYYTDIFDLLNDPNIEFDIVSICTPNGLHAEHSIAVLEAGKDVLCEKPMAIKTADGMNMIKAAEKNNKKLFVVKQNRFNPPVAAVKNIIEQQLLGKIFSVQLSCFWNRNKEYYTDSWRGTNKLDGGTLFTQFSHFIDLLYWMIGDIKTVESYGRNFNHTDTIEFEDTGVAIIEFNNGVLGTLNYTVNSYGKNMEGSLTIFGEKGTVKIGGQYLNELVYQNIENYEIKNLPQSNKPNNYGTYIGSMSNHELIYKNVIDVIQNGAMMSTSAFEGLKTVEIIEKIYQKIQRN